MDDWTRGWTCSKIQEKIERIRTAFPDLREEMNGRLCYIGCFDTDPIKVLAWFRKTYGFNFRRQLGVKSCYTFHKFISIDGKEVVFGEKVNRMLVTRKSSYYFHVEYDDENPLDLWEVIYRLLFCFRQKTSGDIDGPYLKYLEKETENDIIWKI